MDQTPSVVKDLKTLAMILATIAVGLSVWVFAWWLWCAE